MYWCSLHRMQTLGVCHHSQGCRFIPRYSYSTACSLFRQDSILKCSLIPTKIYPTHLYTYPPNTPPEGCWGEIYFRLCCRLIRKLYMVLSTKPNMMVSFYQLVVSMFYNFYIFLEHIIFLPTYCLSSYFRLIFSL